MSTIETQVQKYLKTLFSFYPDRATAQGYPGFDSKWPHFTQDSIDTQIAEFKTLLSETESLQPTEFDDQIDQDLLARKIQTEIFHLQSLAQHKNNPSLYVSLVADTLFTTMMATHLSDEERCESLAERLKTSPVVFKQAQSLIERPISLWTRLAIEKAPGLHAYLNDVILPYLKTHSIAGVDALIEDTATALFSYVNHLEHITNLEPDFSIGRDGFEYLLSTFHGITDSTEDIRQFGFDQIDELTKALSEQAEVIDNQKSWQELVADIKNDHPKEFDLINTYQESVSSLKKFLIKHDLVSLPQKESLDVIETPEFLQNSIPYAAYCPPTMFAKQDRGLFFVSPPKGQSDLLKEHCHSALVLTALHEAYPGHHLQFSIQRTLERTIRKSYDVASYYEGWTLYCEGMMIRHGLGDSRTKLFQLKDRLWRAARVVVDVCMHCYGMTDNEAVDFLVHNAKLSKEGARADVNWYTQYPTAPLSYLYGATQVEKMAKDYTANGHSLKEFHNAFLSCGAIPLKSAQKILSQ